MKNSRGEMSYVAGPVALVIFFASMAYAFWAGVGEAAEPTATFIEWQARWGRGTYGVKATFLATWLNVMTAALVAASVPLSFYYAARSLASPRPPAITGAQWHPLEASGWRNVTLGVLCGLLPSSVVYAVLLIDAESLSFLGSATPLMLMLTPMLMLWGWFAFVNLLMPRRAVVGAISALTVERTDKGAVVRHVAVIDEEKWALPQKTWSALSVGHTLAIVAPAMMSTPFSIKVLASATPFR